MAYPLTLFEQFGANARLSVGGIRCAVNRADAFGQHRVGHASRTRRPRARGVKATGRDTQDATHRAYLKVGVVRHHEFEEFREPTSLPLANQAVAVAKMSSAILSWRSSRSRLDSSRSALLPRHRRAEVCKRLSRPWRPS